MRFVCNTCKRRYRLKDETLSSEILCYHCGSVLRPAQANTTAAQSDVTHVTAEKAGFRTLLQQFSQKRNMSVEEYRLIEEMRGEGVVDTAWLKRHYESDRSKDTEETEVEVVEEFKPLVFGYYQALYAVGEGATGIVYKGWKIGSDELVAMKRLHPDKIADPATKERFFRELRYLKELSHPNILPLLDGGEKDGEYFLITPFIEGGSLKDRLEELPPGRRRPAELGPLWAIVIQIGKALQCAHEHGLVHRDVKPANILLHGDHPYLADFGLARHINLESPAVTRGAVGTPCYMAPELWEQKVSPQVDIYALGVIVYEMLTGTYPFAGSTPAQILASQLHFNPEPPVRDSTLPLLNHLVLRALARDPEKRPRSAGEFTRDLTEILGKEPGL